MAYCPTVLERDMENPLEELEDTFIRAAEFVQNQTTSGKGKKLSQDVMLQIYGLYKTATIGKCTDPKPGKDSKALRGLVYDLKCCSYMYGNVL